MSDPVPLSPIACRQCGARMVTAGTCPACGWCDWLGQALFVPDREVSQRLIDRALMSPPRTAPTGARTPVAPGPLARTGVAAETPGGSRLAARTSTLDEPWASRNPTLLLHPAVVDRSDPPDSPRAIPSAMGATLRSPGVSEESGRSPALAPAPVPQSGGRVTPARRSAARKRFLALRGRLKRIAPPVRLVWVFLGILLWNGGAFVSRSVAEPLLLIPLVAAGTDLAFQAVRFPRLRFPDAALANGLFLSVILWPASFSLALAAVAVVTVGLRHLARVASHPILNPAAAGVVLAAAVFALPQPWHVGSTLRDVELVALLGVILWTKATHTWRILVPYFAVNIALSVFVAYRLGGAASVPLVVQATVLGASTVFYGFFMVSEPRTAPSSRPAMLLFGAVVGAAAALLPALFAEVPTISTLGVLAPYLALFVGNTLTVTLPSARGIRRASTRSAKSTRPSVPPKSALDPG